MRLESAGPSKRGHQAAKDLIDLSPGSSVVMRACYSLVFSYPFIPACLMIINDVSCMLNSYSCCLAVGMGPRDSTKYLPLAGRPQLRGPRKPIENQKKSSLSPSHQKSSKLIPEPSKTM